MVRPEQTRTAAGNQAIAWAPPPIRGPVDPGAGAGARVPTTPGTADPQPEPSEPGRRLRLRVMAIPGSLRRDSFNRRLLVAACSAAPPQLDVVIFDGLKTIPPFDEDDEADPPAPVLELRRGISTADALLVATPEYNSSLPGQLKNALDWASRPHGSSVLKGKPAVVIGASPSPFGAVRAQAAARQVLAASGARVIEDGLAVSRAYEAFDQAGNLSDPALSEQLHDAIRALAHAVRGSVEPQAA